MKSWSGKPKVQWHVWKNWPVRKGGSMEAEIIYDIENFIGVISDNEKRRNRELNRKIAFLRKYLGVWKDDQEFNQMKPNNPYPFYIKKENYDV